MLEFWNTVLFSFAVTGPIFLLLGLGASLARLRAVNDNFVEVGSRLVLLPRNYFPKHITFSMTVVAVQRVEWSAARAVTASVVE